MLNWPFLLLVALLLQKRAQTMLFFMHNANSPQQNCLSEGFRHFLLFSPSFPYYTVCVIYYQAEREDISKLKPFFTETEKKKKLLAKWTKKENTLTIFYLEVSWFFFWPVSLKLFNENSTAKRGVEKQNWE